MNKKDTKTKNYQAIHPEMNRVLQVLANAKFRMRHSPLTSRVLSHYEEKGLLYSTKEKTLGWRTFDAYELVWLEILDQLRAFGYPLENVKKIKEGFLSKDAGKVDTEGNYITRPFEWFIAMSVTSKSQFYFIVLENGDSSFYDDCNPHLWNIENSWMRKPHISIPLSLIISTIWNSITDEKPIEFEAPDVTNVNKSEREILKEVRSGRYESINIQFKNKKPERLVGMERKDVLKRVEEVLREHKYQTIELVEADGKVVSILSHVSKKLS